MKLNYFVIAIAAFWFAGCASKKTNTTRGGVLAGNKNVEVILDSLKVMENHMPNTLAFKTNVEFEADGKTTSLKGYIRMVPDSAIWISVSAYSIEVARVLATPDSLSFLSKTEKKYYTGNYDFISDKMGVKLGFTELQALFLGHSIGVKGMNQIQKRNDKAYYVLSSHKKGQLKRLESGKQVNSNSEVAYSNWVNSATFTTEKIAMFNLVNQNSARIHYSAFEKKEGVNILMQMQMHIIAGKEIKVETRNSKVVVNSPVRMPFKISSKYEKML